jgi:urease accessory protein
VSALLCRQVLKVLAEVHENDGDLDLLDVSWADLDRRAIQGVTRGGQAVRIILPAGQSLEHGAVVGSNGQRQIVVHLLPCPALVIGVESPLELAQTAYLLGNLHLPIEIRDREILLPANDHAEAALGRLGIASQLQMRRVRPLANGLGRFTLAEG